MAPTKRGRERGGVPPWAALVAVAVGSAATIGAAALATRGIEPAATWIYPFAWYPLLLALEGGVALRRGRFLLLDDPLLLLSVMAWSVPLWMLWELLNLRVENWYYVFVPAGRGPLWAGIVLSFATVLPACFLPAALVWPGSGRAGEGAGAVGRDGAAGLRRSAPVVSRRRLRAVRAGGAFMLLLSLVWPRIFFPLIWGGFVLLVEPDLYRKAPDRSLLADVLVGRKDRIGALLVGGAVAGLAWESLNFIGRGRWIYTVPGLEQLKLFEMPLLGFLGFPALAVSCYSLYQWLALRGWSRPLTLEPEGPDIPAEQGGGPGRVDDVGPVVAEDSRTVRRPAVSGSAAAAGAAVLVVVALAAIEAHTVSSRTPRIRDLPGLLPSDVEILSAWGVDSPFDLAERDPGSLAASLPPSMDEERVRSWIEAARMATTRGMGTRHVRILHGWGITSLEDLALADPEELAARFEAYEGNADVRPAQVRVWWRAARNAVTRARQAP